MVLNDSSLRMRLKTVSPSILGMLRSETMSLRSFRIGVRARPAEKRQGLFAVRNAKDNSREAGFADSVAKQECGPVFIFYM